MLSGDAIARQAGGPLLATTKLSGGFHGTHVFRDVSLEVRAGEVVGLIGPNGGGKSSLLKTVAGIMDAYAGEMVRAPGLRIGYVPQQLPFDRTLPISVLEFLALRASRSRFWFGHANGAERALVHKHLHDLGADHLEQRRLGELSGGELQRVLVASALLNKPHVLLLDEPLTGVDVRGGLSFDAVLHHVRDHLRLGVLMVSHDLELVAHICSRIYCLNGEIRCEGAPRDVLTSENLTKAFGVKHSGLQKWLEHEAFIPLSKITVC